jgi:hypothetical protein
VYNHWKLDAFVRTGFDFLHNIVFLDVDTVVLRDPAGEPDSLFDPDFDIAIGRRSGGDRVPYNGGVVLCQPNDDTVLWFLRRWLEVDYRMLRDQEFHQRYRATYNGQNQASFGYMVETYGDQIKLHEYPTSMINAVGPDWLNVESNPPYILHVRKRLLAAAQSDVPIHRLPHDLQKAAKIWRYYENLR